MVDPDLQETHIALTRFASRTDPRTLDIAIKISGGKVAEDPSHYGLSETEAGAMHYLFWSKNGANLGVSSYRESFARWLRNPSSAADLVEIADWRRRKHKFPVRPIDLSFDCPLQLHAAYGLREITSIFGKADLQTTGPAGVGMIHVENPRIYIHLVTFRKQDHQFAPTTRYKDYPISPTRLHWESQVGTIREGSTGQNYIHFRERGYTILFFARLDKLVNRATAPFIFLGPAKDLLSYESDRPIKMIWELEHAMPAELFEAAKTT